MRESTLLGQRILRIRRERWTKTEIAMAPKASDSAIFYRSCTGFAVADYSQFSGQDDRFAWEASVWLFIAWDDIIAGRKRPLTFYAPSPLALERLFGQLLGDMTDPEVIDLEIFEAEPLPAELDGLCLDPDPELVLCDQCGEAVGDPGPGRCKCEEVI